MADFTSLRLEVNTNTQGSPTWTQASDSANHEIRFHNTSTAGLGVASASWPYFIRPAAAGGIDYAYVYTADATGLGVLGAGGNPTAFSNANYLQARWTWDNTGTFASAPIISSYPDTSHGSITAGDGSMNGGSAADTSSTSYLKANAFGRVTSAGAPAGAPGAAPALTNGTGGSVSPAAGANWLAAYQDLAGAIDYITAPFTPAATTTDSWNMIFRLFSGPHMNTGTFLPTLSLVYTFA